jgi:26S proteasome regulatory subunit N12
MSSVESMLSQLEGLVQSGSIEPAKALLGRLKVELLTGPGGPPVAHASAYELGVLISVSEEDLEGVGRNYAQLQPFYSSGVTTPRKAHVVGLNLMSLLIDNRWSEFHSQLELLTEQEASDPFISFPIRLERKLMVGIYDEVLTESPPHPSYGMFMEHLLQTVRDSIADCMEVSYKSLSLQAAASMMKFGSVDQLREYVSEYRDDWIVEEDGAGSGAAALTFQPPPVASAASDIPSMQWIQQSLSYATEMERII